MEAGIALLLLLLGYNIIDTDETVQEKPSVKIEEIKNNKENVDYDFIINKKSGERFFKNDYQLLIKQYHYEENVRITDSITNMSLNSAKTMFITDSYKNIDENEIPYEVLFKFRSKFIPNKEETEFNSNYNINYSENYTESTGVNSRFQIKLSKDDVFNLNDKILVNHKNYEYELSIKKTKESELYKNIETLNCKEDITCKILKENTIFFKNGKLKKEPLKKIEVKKEEIKNQTITFDNYIIHKVKKGETINQIANNYNSSPLLIKKINNKKNYNLKVDEEILVANKTTVLHKIKRNENLFKISNRYNKKISTLKKMNDMKSDLIYNDYIMIIDY